MKKITLLIMILGIVTISNAQIEIKELKLTPEIEEMVITKIKNWPIKDYSEYGIINSSQLMNLHLGKPVPNYWIVGKKIERLTIWNASQISDEVPLSLRFMDTWTVPVMLDEEPLLFVVTASSDFIGVFNGIKNTKEHFHTYELKDSIIGCIGVESSMEYLIIRKENQDIFVQVYDEVTGEYFKNEYSFSELISHLKALSLRKREADRKYYERYYAQVADKSELILTPEITEMEITRIKNMPEMFYSSYGITDRSQLDHLHLGKPIPMYIIVNENLTFTGQWFVLLMSDGEPLRRLILKLDDDGQYRWVGSGSRGRSIHNYEHKDLIIGILGTTSFHGVDYVMIRRDNQDIFVQWYNRDTREYLKNEYTLSEIMNMIKE